MRALYKTTAMLAASAAMLGLTACGGAKTPEQLILGDWVQASPVSMTEGGMTITLKDTTATYNADGTSKGGGTMVLGGLPDDMSTFMIMGDATWSLADGVLKETVTSAKVKPGTPSAGAVTIATQVEQEMNKSTTTESEIVSLTKDELIVRDMESDITMSYKRK